MHRRTAPWLIGTVVAACVIAPSVPVLAARPNRRISRAPTGYSANGFLYLGYALEVPSVPLSERVKAWRAIHPPPERPPVYQYQRQVSPRYYMDEPHEWRSNSRREF